MVSQGYGKEQLRHWHPQSEKYSGADSLFTAIHNGWQMSKEVFRQTLSYSGRPVTIYHITLKLQENTTLMRVISNPFIERYIKHSNCTVFSFDEGLDAPASVEAQKLAS